MMGCGYSGIITINKSTGRSVEFVLTELTHQILLRVNVAKEMKQLNISHYTVKNIILLEAKRWTVYMTLVSVQGTTEASISLKLYYLHHHGTTISAKNNIIVKKHCLKL